MGERLRSLLWFAAGTLFLLVFGLLFVHFREDPSERIALKAKRLELVEQMLGGLTSASEAEKSAVLAITDEDSQAFADEARARAATVEGKRKELEALLQTGGNQNERDLLIRFSTAFSEYRRVDDEVLGLAVRNTNLKAASLAYGPAAEAITELDGALSRLVTASASSTSPQARTVMLLASRADAAALRLQILLPPHIAEESDQKMNDLEARMTREDQEVRKNLDALASLPPQGGSADVQTARASYVRFGEIRAQILALSRENTNVRSLSLSLNQKRKVMMTCEEILVALERAIRDEPTVSVPAPPR